MTIQLYADTVCCEGRSTTTANASPNLVLKHCKKNAYSVDKSARVAEAETQPVASVQL